MNLGFALTIWDQIFHRAVFPNEATVGIDTGLPGRPLIVEQATPRPQHFAVLAAQMVAPFRPMRDAHRAPVHPISPPSVRRSDECAPRRASDLRTACSVPSGEVASW